MGARVIETLLAGLTDSSGSPLSGGKVYTKEAGTSTDKATYTDIDKTTPAANPIVLDANGRAQIFAEGAYKLIVDNSDDDTLYTWDDLEFISDSESVRWGSSSGGSSNSYTLTLSPAPSAYATGDHFTFISNHANTGSATLNINSLGAKTLKDAQGNALDGGEIQNGQGLVAFYDGTDFIIVSELTDIYETTEVLTGKVWIDGKAIYRKVVDLGTLPNATTDTTAHGITGISNFISLTGFAYDSTGPLRFCLPHSTTTLNQTIGLYANDTNITVITGIDRTSFTTAYAIIEYTKS